MNCCFCNIPVISNNMGQYLDARCEECIFRTAGYVTTYYSFLCWHQVDESIAPFKIILRKGNYKHFIELKYVNSKFANIKWRDIPDKYVLLEHNGDKQIEICSLDTTTPSIEDSLYLMDKVKKLKLYT
jgi:hypothetical protein